MRLGPKHSKGKLLDTQCLLFINSKALALAYEARDEPPRCVTLASIGVGNLRRRTNIEPLRDRNKMLPRCDIKFLHRCT